MHVAEAAPSLADHIPVALEAHPPHAGAELPVGGSIAMQNSFLTVFHVSLAKQHNGHERLALDLEHLMRITIFHALRGGDRDPHDKVRDAIHIEGHDIPSEPEHPVQIVDAGSVGESERPPFGVY